ncbi:MAG: glycosyltransferase family 4 protein [Thermoplasmata archaeon]
MNDRVVLICRVLWSAGTAKVSAEQCRYLNEAGVQCHLDYIRRGPNSEAYSGYLQGVDYSIIRRRGNPLAPLWAFVTNVAHGVPEKGAHPLEGGLDLDSLWLATMHVARHRPKVILASDQFSGIVAYLVHRLRGTPYVVYLQEGIYEDPNRQMTHLPESGRSRIRRLARILDREVFGHAACVLGITEATLQSVWRSGYKVPGRVVFLGAPTHEPGPVRDRKPIILSVATWDKARYPELYLDVARRLKGCRLVMAGLWRYGYENERIRFQSIIDREGLADRITVTGRLSEPELIAYYAEAKAFLRLGVDEMGVGGGCLDALSWGVPIITNRSLGITDILVDGVNGRVLETINPREIAEAINELMADNDGYRRISLAAYATATEYSWARHAKLLSEALLQAECSTCPQCLGSFSTLKTPAPQ